MRKIGYLLVVFIASILAMTSVSMAQTTSLKTCPSVDLTAPADGAVLDKGYRINFTWDSEPRGTASRDWVSIRIGGDDVSFDDAKRVTAERGIHKAFARGRAGLYAWAVIFYDAKGNPICISEARTYVVTEEGFTYLTGDNGAMTAAAKAALGRYVIVLTGSGRSKDNAYTGSSPYLEVKADSYDGRGQVPAGYSGLEIHGNKNGNVIVGSELDDLIFGYGNIDILSGDAGNDTINGGTSTRLYFRWQR